MPFVYLGDWLAGIPPLAYAATLASGGVLLGCIVLWSFKRLRYLRLVEDMPTARVRSAPQGYVELEGEARPFRGRALRSPLRGVPCVWWSYRVEEFTSEVDPVDGPGGAIARLALSAFRALRIRHTGRLLDSGRSHEPFLIRDATAACVVDSAEAHVFRPRSTTWHAAGRRYEEAVIPAGARLYALGLFRTPQGYAEDLEKREVGALISTWKLDRIALARRFDADGDGVIDEAEWTTAWQAAAAEIRQLRALEPYPDLHVLCQPRDRRPFVLSVLGQRRLANHFWFQTMAGLLSAATLATILVWSLQVRGVF
jgi:hypothetical protein